MSAFEIKKVDQSNGGFQPGMRRSSSVGLT
jgi:hypothetical protein